MKKFSCSLLVFLLTLLGTTAYSQANDFKIYVFSASWGDQSTQYLHANRNFQFIKILTQGGISTKRSDTVLSVGAVERFLKSRYPDPKSEDLLLLDWEGTTYDNLRDLDMADARFKYSEKQFLALIKTVRQIRPGLKLAFYGLPFRFFNEWQKTHYNQPTGKLDKILAQVDVIAPSFYILYPDEQVKHDRNIKFLRENLDAALRYGQQLNKPVIPLVWHKVHPDNKQYATALIQPEIFASYVKFISTYSFRNQRVSGVMWWDDLKQNARITNLRALNNWTQGRVTNEPTYDTMMIRYVKAVTQALGGTSKF